ncbi:di-heme oxidoredictase family protein, partial [Psychrobacter proteolyticus]|uniref:di-heme oxidoredictase family protein n=1 Tax=Psychrobacter proteolyticus TaxID=147825 RepID=UPI00311D586E
MGLAMIGLGLLEQIPDDDINKQARDSNDSDISGKLNWVMDPQTGKRALGR